MEQKISPWDKWLNEVISGKKFPRLPLLDGNALVYLAEEIVRGRGYILSEEITWKHNIQLTDRYAL